MAQSRGNLSGSGPFFVMIDVWYSGVQDWGANSSRFDWAVYIGCDSNGWPTWSGGTQNWYASIGGTNYSGTFVLDFRPGSSSNRLIQVGSGSTWHGHDGEGYRGGFASDAFISTNHSSVGEGGSGQAWVDAPRIPQLPAAPNSLSTGNITPTSFGVWYNRGDARGAGIEQDRLHWYEGGPAGQGVVVWEDLNAAGYSNPAGGAGPRLKPGTEYWVYVSSRNVRGWGPWAGPIKAKTLSGAYVWNGGAWVPTEVYVWTGTAWKTAEVNTYRSNGWSTAG